MKPDSGPDVDLSRLTSSKVVSLQVQGRPGVNFYLNSNSNQETNLWHKKLVVWVELQLFRLEMVPPLDEMPANHFSSNLSLDPEWGFDEDIRELTLQRLEQLDPRLPPPHRAKASLVKLCQGAKCIFSF